MSLDISFESSARQRIYMKHQVLFSLQDKSKKKMSSAATLLGLLRVKIKNSIIFLVIC